MRIIKQFNKITISTIIVFIFVLVSYLLPHLVWAQGVNCSSGTRVQGGLISTPDLSGSKFLSSTGNCVAGSDSTQLPSAAIAPYTLPQYADLKADYFDRAKAPYKQATVTNTDFNASGNSVATDLTTTDSTIWVNGDLNINGSISSSVTHTGVIFVEGNLNIRNDVIYPPAGSNAGLVFVVKGNINIFRIGQVGQEVKEVDAVLIGQGKISTAADTSNGCPADGVTTCSPISDNPLIIKGSIIGLPPTDPTITQQILLRRALFNNNTPAEQVFLQPKYLTILKNLFTQTLSIQTEGSSFSGSSDISTPAPSISFHSDQSTVTLDGYSNGSFHLNWSTGNNPAAVSCTASSNPYDSNFYGAEPISNPSYLINVSSPGVYKYSLSCSSQFGTSSTSTVTVTVNPDPNTLSISPTTPCAGNASCGGQSTNTITWNQISPTPSSSDTIALYSVGATGSTYISCISNAAGSCQGTCTGLGTASSGSCSYSGNSFIPDYVPSGPYELRYIPGGSFTNPPTSTLKFNINN